MSARDLLRTNEAVYKELDFDTANFTEDYIVEMMSQNPDLIQRPIVERGGKAIVARPPEKIYEIL